MLLSRRSLLLAAPALIASRSALAELLPTPSATEGPFYPRAFPADQDNDLVKVEGALRDAGGDILQLAGRVRDRNGRAVADARIEIWQCDLNGIYLHPGDSRLARRDPAFQGFGHAIADAEGRFAFRTIVPVPYSGRTPHIHAKVLDGRTELLTTQLYRAGFAQNASDFVFRRLSPAEQARAAMTFAPVAGAARPTFRTAVEIVV